jgi:acetyl esterase
MPLHPVIESALRASSVRPYRELGVAQARVQAKSGAPAKPDVALAAVRDVLIPGPGGDIPARVYTPQGQGPHPVLMFFHGGGFVVLDLDSHDYICMRLAAGAACVVVSVDYRLAPEHQFPAGPDDCLAATRWAAAHAAEFGGDGSRLAVSGLSAGATMAAVTALRARDEGGPALRGQALFYPVTDYPTLLNASYQTYANGYGLTQDNMLWFWEQYLQTPAAGTHPYASPLRAESLAGLPPACVFVAECDVLHDEGAAYAQRMQQAGVATHFEVCRGTAHSFLKYAGVLPEVDAVLAKTYGWLRGVLAGSVSPPRA